MSLPQFALEMHEVVPSFVKAVLGEEDGGDLAAMLVPSRNVDLAYRLFGYVPLYFLLGGHLRCGAFAIARMGQHQETGEVRVEIVWARDQDELQRQVFQPDAFFTMALRQYRRKWRVQDINPAPADALVTLRQVREKIEEMDEQSGYWLPYNLLAGNLQVERWETEQLDDVESLFVPYMQEVGFGLWELTSALRLWRDFKKKAKPSYRKPGVYAAAVEYAMVLFGFYEGSQAGIGEAYGVSGGTVGVKFQEIERALNLYQYDERYSQMEDPSAPLRALWKQIGVKGPPKMRLGGGRRGGWNFGLW
ncbi:MAG: hypothetical protein ACETWR_25010 [Anaerolineae bacterium]